MSATAKVVIYVPPELFDFARSFSDIDVDRSRNRHEGQYVDPAVSTLHDRRVRIQRAPGDTGRPRHR